MSFYFFFKLCRRGGTSGLSFNTVRLVLISMVRGFLGDCSILLLCLSTNFLLRSISLILISIVLVSLGDDLRLFLILHFINFIIFVWGHNFITFRWFLCSRCLFMLINVFFGCRIVRLGFSMMRVLCWLILMHFTDLRSFVIVIHDAFYPYLLIFNDCW